MKIAVITGASSGIGRQFALDADRNERFDEIWLIARDRAKLTRTADMMRTKTRVIPLDLAEHESIDSLYRLLGEMQPEIEILVNAAGFGKIGASDVIGRRDTEDMIRVNVLALADICLVCIPFMHNGSRIINMSSVSAYLPLPYLNVYAATKAFVLRFSQGLHNELRQKGISVTAVCPYWVDTNFIPTAKDSPGARSVTRFPLMADAAHVVRKAMRDSLNGRMLSFFGTAANTVHVLSCVMPACARMAIWNIIRR